MSSTIRLIGFVLCVLHECALAQQWTPLDPIGNAQGATTAWDPVRQRVVLFGGGSGHYGLSWTEPWFWDGRSWSPFAQRGDTPRPDGVSAAAIAWDGRNQRILMFGGARLSPFIFSNETWAFTGDQWYRLAPVHSPTGRSFHAMTYDEARQRVVLFGGADSAGSRGDTWEWDGNDWLERTPAFGPPRGFRNGLCYDRGRQLVVLVGGPGTNASTWEWNGVGWALSPATLPGHLAPIAYDSVHRRVVLFGGATSTYSSADTWEYDGRTWNRRVVANAPPARQLNALAYDEVSQRVVLYGGLLDDPSTARDTWLWDSTSWALVPGSARPEAREGHMMAPFFQYPPHLIVLFGGSRLGLNTSDETWVWDGLLWQQRQPAVHPPARQYGAMAYDTNRRRIVLFGGIAQTNGTSQPFNDTWEWDGQTWQQRVPSRIPPSRYTHAMAYDQGRDRVVMFGGRQFFRSPTVNDHWEWNGNDWQAVSTSTPPGLAGHAMAYSEYSRRVVLFGGTDGNSATAETWELDATGWSRRRPTDSPPARLYHAMCFDAGSGRIFLHGGEGSEFRGPVLGDTWEWDGVNWATKASDRTPIARYGHAMAYDFARRRPMMIGGADPNLRDDAWFFSPTPFQSVPYGSSCARATGPLRLATIGAPRIAAGTNGVPPFAFELAGANPFAPLAIAIALQPDARSLGTCTAWIGTSIGLLWGISSASGFASLPLSLPNDPLLRGLEFFAQGMTAEAGGLALSGALRCAIGD